MSDSGTIRIPLEAISKKAETRPEGYYEAVISAGLVIGHELVLWEHIWVELCERYRSGRPAENNGTEAAPHALILARVAICEQCEFGTRRGHGCLRCPGCHRVKHWLFRQSCPENKWPKA